MLGPLLFSLFINDLPSIVRSPLVLFADDANIYHSIQSDEDYQLLQQDLDNLYKWSEDWQLCFNVTKCKVLHIGFNQHNRVYRLGSDCITSSTVEKDLGILVDNKLKFHEQCSAVVAKANRLLGVIRWSFDCTNAEMILRLYKSLIRPVIEYGNIIWGPFYAMDQQAIEEVQHRATKIIPELRHYSYQERLQRLSLPSLVHRWLRGEMIFLYQQTHQYFNIDINSLLHYQSSITRGHCYQIYKPHSQTFCRANFFTVRTINDWNNLPVNAVECSSINLFKNLIDNYWTNKQYEIV